ncbi:MAG: hypothetical protein BWX68_00235 [Verrucomicrobia bacterium ADurb.Bin063]|nr:MAG: hypothetical protein BWX68_00235 [Verrucomicrobia bacterium ADurb.Bin063]
MPAGPAVARRCSQTNPTIPSAGPHAGSPNSLCQILHSYIANLLRLKPSLKWAPARRTPRRARSGRWFPAFKAAGVWYGPSPTARTALPTATATCAGTRKSNALLRARRRSSPVVPREKLPPALPPNVESSVPAHVILPPPPSAVHAAGSRARGRRRRAHSGKMPGGAEPVWSQPGAMPRPAGSPMRVRLLFRRRLFLSPSGS